MNKMLDCILRSKMTRNIIAVNVSILALYRCLCGLAVKCQKVSRTALCSHSGRDRKCTCFEINISNTQERVTMSCPLLPLKL